MPRLESDEVMARPATHTESTSPGRDDPPKVLLGVDTLCWHTRLETGAVDLQAIVDTAQRLQCDYVQVNLHHLRKAGVAGVERLRENASGMSLLASGDFLGAARSGDTVADGVDRVRRWLEGTAAMGSPILRVASGFYRSELAGRPDLIRDEQTFVTDVLDRTADEALASGIRLLLENHSDFSISEYQAIVSAVGLERTGVFLDMINAVAELADPVRVVEQLAPLSPAGHVKDFIFRSIQQPDGYHRRGFEVLYRYPGEGVAPLSQLVAALLAGTDGRGFHLAIEGLDNAADIDDQEARIAMSLACLRRLINEPRP